jgi:selenide, water dikinase
VGPGDLARALEGLPTKTDPRLIVGHETFDDAGVFLISDDVALVQTVDFFAPIVDDPYVFGQVAAANALSDVYAMGGQPLTAMNIVAFPVDQLPMEVLHEILRGGLDKVHEAGAHVVGGHSIIDEELKYGLAVTGRAHPKFLLTNAAARPGDQLVLTKPIGTGVLATALKAGKLELAAQQPFMESMRALNGAASRTALALGVRCATDVTGFGLLGHASHIARASNVTVQIRASDVSFFPGAVDALELGASTSGLRRNLEYLEPMTDWGSTPEPIRSLLADPQTSGGLLVCIPGSKLEEYLSRVPGAVAIGEIRDRIHTALTVM